MVFDMHDLHHTWLLSWGHPRITIPPERCVARRVERTDTYEEHSKGRPRGHQLWCKRTDGDCMQWFSQSTLTTITASICHGRGEPSQYVQSDLQKQHATKQWLDGRDTLVEFGRLEPFPTGSLKAIEHLTCGAADHRPENRRRWDVSCGCRPRTCC